jgi:exodeoxyribonuclease-5
MPITLSQEQQHVVDDLLSLIRLPQPRAIEATLTGPAGTGKTTVIQALCHAIPEDYPVLVAAPTHKAAAVLREKNETVNVVTIDALLSTKPVENDQKGTLDFTVSKPEDTMRKRWRGYEGGVLIIDEASMLSHERVETILRVFGTHFRLVLIAGDSAQLPPIKAVQTPYAGADPDLNPAAVQYYLTEVVRHGGAILTLATVLRSGLDWQFTDHTGTNEVVVYESKATFEQTWLNRVDDPRVKALAYTNRRVNELNSLAVLNVYGPGSDKKFIRGQRLVTDNVLKDDDGETIYRGNVELTVVEQVAVEPYHSNFGVPFDLVTLVVMDDTFNHRTIKVVAAWDREYHADLLKAYHKACLNKADGVSFFRYWLMYGLGVVKYAYALTVHKSQGSTYETVFLDADDIDGAHKDREELLYVGVTRASKNLHILTSA